MGDHLKRDAVYPLGKYIQNTVGMKDNTKITLRGLTKGNVWDLQENDIFALWANPEKEDELSERGPHYMDIVKTAFDVEEIKIDAPEVIRKYEERGMKVGILYIKGEPNRKREAEKLRIRARMHESEDGESVEEQPRPKEEKKKREPKYAIRKHPINKVTDLSYENIRHISAAKLLDIIAGNFGGGWDSLNQGIKDVILSAFDISTTTTAKTRLHKPGGLYEIKVSDGYEVLEIEKGSWVEAIFAKVKPMATKLKIKFNEDEDEKYKDLSSQEEEADSDEDVIVKDDYYAQDEDDIEPDEDSLTAESYRTTIEEDPDDLSLEDAEDLSDDDY